MSVDRYVIFVLLVNYEKLECFCKTYAKSGKGIDFKTKLTGYANLGSYHESEYSKIIVIGLRILKLHWCGKGTKRDNYTFWSANSIKSLVELV